MNKNSITDSQDKIMVDKNRSMNGHDKLLGLTRQESSMDENKSVNRQEQRRGWTSTEEYMDKYIPKRTSNGVWNDMHRTHIAVEVSWSVLLPGRMGQVPPNWIQERGGHSLER
jgi:hypothetical protein